jgi:hypothetical protein
MRNDEAFVLNCALADLKGSLEAHESMDRLAHDWKAHAQTIADIEDVLNEMGYAKRVEKALREVVDSWEQGGTPIEINAAMNRAADVLHAEKEV